MKDFVGGFVDNVLGRVVSGWAIADGEECAVDVTVDGVLILTV